MENLYDILEVSKKASKEIIEKAYKTLAKKYHPDLQTPENKSKAEEMMKKINEAYDILSDEQKRKEYDEKIEEENRQKNYYQPDNKEDSQNYKENSNNYYKENNNVEYQSNYNYKQNYNYANQNQNYNTEFENWREVYSKLTPKEQAKLRKKYKGKQIMNIDNYMKIILEV